MTQPEAIPTPDGAVIGLTRRTGGPRGPVIMAPGFGMRAASFAVPARRPNLVDTLAGAGFDVWLLDYRTSPAVAPQPNCFDLDQIAAFDWPTAVDEVRRRTGSPRIAVVNHCVGSLTFLMAVTGGHIDPAAVSSAVCSQVGLHAHADHLNRLKSRIRLASLMWTSGLRTVAPYRGLSAKKLLIDTALSLNPTLGRERCHNPTCRWVFGIFGSSYCHDQLDRATHDAIVGLFGPVSGWAFRHLSRVVLAGRAVDVDGNDRYLPHLDRITFPVLLLSGERNRQFRASGTAATLDALRRVHPRGYHRRVTLARYGHLDCLIGRDADTDVYPWILDHLDRTVPDGGTDRGEHHDACLLRDE